MPRCPSCREYLSGDRERIGARCPYCHDPLYERPSVPERTSGQPGTPENACALHPGNVASGTCQRCGNYLCKVCRTRWRNRSLCIACVERALESRETHPEEARAHFRQAVLSLVFGAGAWVIAATAFALIFLGARSGDVGEVVMVVGIAGLLLFGSPICAVLGVAQGAAAIRARGDHMIMATFGLFLSGIQVGVILGLFGLAAWNN